MTIPGARFDDVPPPLPPPRFNEDLAHGIDVAWSWANRNPFGHSPAHLAPISADLTLRSGRRESANIYPSRVRVEDEMDLDHDDDDEPRRGSNVSTIRSLSYNEIRVPEHLPSLVRRPPSPSRTNQR